MALLVGLLVLTLLDAALARVAAAPARRSNVIIFLADDAGWGDYRLTGNTQVRTPNIDLIAQRGASLDRFYVCAVCAPTRAEFFTGRYHSRGGVRGGSTGQERLNTDAKTIADAFKAAGYATGAFGKWHNGSQWPYHPNARGFDEYYGFTSGHWGEYFDPPLEHNGRPVRGHGVIPQKGNALYFQEQNSSGAAPGNFTVQLDDETLPKLTSYTGKKIVFGIHPENIADTTSAGSGPTGQTVQAAAEVFEPMGSEAYLYLTSGSQSFVARVHANNRVNVNQKVSLVFDMSKAHFFDPATEKAII